VSALLFPDNTVLVNFALIGRVDLFQRLASGRSTWTYTVAVECERSSREAGLEALARMPEILGPPIMPTRRERIDARLIRQQIASPGEPESRHLGEAEALAILTARTVDAVFITDDSDAVALAAGLGIRTYSSTDLIRLAVRGGLISGEDAWSHIGLLRANKRAVRGVPTDYASFQAWCGV
jgi:predicted nucleic acid-binding protein